MKELTVLAGVLLYLALAASTSGALAAEPLRVELDLADARFIIRAAGGSGPVEIDAGGTERPFSLKRESDIGEDGLRSERIRFRGTKKHHRKKDTGADGLHWHLDTVDVSIPRDRPLSLELVVHRGESEIDLGGLTLTRLGVELLSGDHRLDVRQPVRGRLDTVRVRASRGSFRLAGLANLRAREILFKGSAGDWQVEFDGDWVDRSESVVRLHAAMGDLNVVMPRHVRLLEDSTSRAFMGDSAKEAVARAVSDSLDTGPAVLLKMRMTMGDSSLRRF